MFRFLLVMSLVTLGSSSRQLRATKQLEYYPYGEKVSFAQPQSLPVKLYMARGEYEIWTFRFPEVSSNELISNVEIDWKGAAPSMWSLQTYWIGVHPLKFSSTGLTKKIKNVADILVPIELMRAKEIQVPSSNKPLEAQYLFELYLPKNTTPGIFSGTLKWTLAEKKFTAPLELSISDLQLPDKFTLKTSVGFAPWEVLRKHYGSWNAKEKELYEIYYQQALEHRIDLHKIYVKFPEKNAQDPLKDGPLGTMSFISQTGPLFSGAHSPQQFKFMVTDLPVPETYKNLHEVKLSLKESELFWRRLNRSVLKNGLKEKTFVYFVDEPPQAEASKIAENLKIIRAWAPDLDFLVTTPYRQEWDGAVNLWCLNLILWDQPSGKGPQFYQARKKEKNESFWFYVGCNSHGCQGEEAIENPDMIMDRSSAYHRVFPWMALRYEAEGILYYDSVYGYSHGSSASPWADAFSFTGYGEGNLFYPCGPSIAGCKTHHALPSLRLKVLRDGLEDVQILKMRESDGISVTEKVRNLVPQVRSFKTDLKSYNDLKIWALEARKAETHGR